MKRGTVLAWPGLCTRVLLARHCDQEKRAAGAQRRPCVPPTLSYQTHRPPGVTLNLPEKLTLTQFSPRLLRMTAELTAAICFEVSSQVLPLCVWVERRDAQVHNSAVVCACRCSHTWLWGWLHVYIYTCPCGPTRRSWGCLFLLEPLYILSFCPGQAVLHF